MIVRRALICSVAALALTSAGASVASAMPVRGVVADTDGSWASIGATAYSPPNSPCGAEYFVGVFPRNGSVYGSPLRSKTGRFNACRRMFDDGWSAGYVYANFNVKNLPVGYYKVCVAARQVVNGSWSNHLVCRIRRI